MVVHRVCLRYLLVINLLLYMQEALASHQDLFDLPLSELVNLKVSVASFQKENLDWSSASVTRYSRLDMEALGVHSIPDMLKLVPGVVVQPGQHGNEQIMVRGIVDSWNQKILFLLNDTPYWMASHGEIPLRGIPFIAIDHIEVIRGPGAVVHGSNATSAVIKVVTRKDDENDISVMAGSHSSYDGGVYVSNEKDTFDYTLSLQGWSDGHIDAEINGALAMPSSGEISFDREGQSAMFQVHLSDFEIVLHHYEMTYEGIDGFASATNYSSTDYETELVRLAFVHEWDSFSLEVHSEYNQSSFTSEVENIISPIGIDVGAGSIAFDDDGNKNYRWRSGWITNYQVQQHTITFGYDYEVRSTEALSAYVPGLTGDAPFSTLFPAARKFENTAYLQDDWTQGSWRFVTGIRYVDEHGSSESDWLPRLTIMFRIDEQRTLRAMYGIGYNAPSFAQGGHLLTNVILPPPKTLQHEKIKATELAYREQYQYWLWGANFYYFETEDFINPVFNHETTLFENTENFDRYGFEFEVDYKFNYLRVFSNIAYQYQGQRQIDDDSSAVLVPKLTTVLGAEYRINKHTVGGTWLHHTSRHLASALDQLTIRYSYHIQAWHFSIIAKNLADDELEVQDSRTQALIIQDMKPEALLEVRYTFD